MITLYVDPSKKWSLFQTEMTNGILLNHDNCDGTGTTPGSITMYHSNYACWRCGERIPEKVRRMWRFLNEMSSI